jgi:hypothetical protein
MVLTNDVHHPTPEPHPYCPPPWLPARRALKHEIPGGAMTVYNRLLKNGWYAEVLYARGPWINGHSMEPDRMTMLAVGSDLAVEPVELVAIASSILVRAARAGQQVAAQWILRPGLKGASFKLAFAYADPPHFGNASGRIDSKQLKLITEATP